MKIIIPCQFEMQPRPDQSSRQCLALARGVAVAWIQRHFANAGCSPTSFNIAAICSVYKTVILMQLIKTKTARQEHQRCVGGGCKG